MRIYMIPPSPNRALNFDIFYIVDRKNEIEFVRWTSSGFINSILKRDNRQKYFQLGSN